MRKFSIILLCCLAAGCSQSPFGNNGYEYPDSMDVATFDTSIYDGPYKIPAMFGSLAPHILVEVPDIPGAVYKTNLNVHILLRCPQDKGVLFWTAARMKVFADKVRDGRSSQDKSTVDPCLDPSSAESISSFYIDALGGNDTDIVVPKDAFEQFGEALIDIYKTSRYCTMEEDNWYDFWSCGVNFKTSWFTIDRNTGKELKLYDIIKDDAYETFQEMVLEHLRNWEGHWTNEQPIFCRPEDIVENISGIALVREGVVVYIHPYVIACGGDGQFNALIPYAEIKDLLKIDISTLTAE